MMIHRLELTHFRNYSKRTINFQREITVFLGPNAIGKTNILEALFLLATGKSFRADRDTEMITWEEEVGRVKAKIVSPYVIPGLPAGRQAWTGNPLLCKTKDPRFCEDDKKENPRQHFENREPDFVELEIVLTGGMVMGMKAPLKKFLVNGVSKRIVDFVGNMPSVLFWPEDLELVIDSPSLRRRYLDFVLTQTDWEYRRSLLSYEKGVRQRNRLLERIRDEDIARSQLIFWDQLLIKDGNYLTKKREEYLEYINRSPKPFGDFKLVYDPSFISAARLEQYKDAEVASGVTLVGPHRDDFGFFESDRDMAKFGSRGEQRLIVLWLKLAELEYIEYAIQKRPMLLLDDIFSELDHKHREEILKIVNKQQTIITTADRHFLPEGLLKVAEVVELGK